MKNKKLFTMCLCGLFTAIVFVFTAYLHFPTHTGYTHVGDAFIYLAACLLPLPYAIFVGGIGALLADVLTGFAMWAPASIVIKSLAVCFFSHSNKKVITARNMIALIPACAMCIVGYYLYESAITMNFIVPLGGIPGYITQSVLSCTLFVIMGKSLDRLKFKEMIQR